MSIVQFLWFLFVFFLVIAMAYYITRYFASFTVSMNKTRYIKVVDRYIIGRDKYIILVRVDKYFYLIGVTNNDVKLIDDYSEIGDFIEDSKNTTLESFKKILNKYIKGKK
ncbi:MAG: flagellar biosynthetic protein FliO [Thermoanaerobacteraceae bacterium]|nr:flagellar biosynthetic protein FliO [Thermoanaerobacteraceae bacterium]